MVPSKSGLQSGWTTPALARWHQVVWVWDLASGNLVQTLQGHEDAVLGVCYSADGRLLASAGPSRNTPLGRRHRQTELHH